MDPPLLQHHLGKQPLRYKLTNVDESSLETIPCFVETVEEALPADGRSTGSVLQSPNSAVTPVVITGKFSLVQSAAARTDAACANEIVKEVQGLENVLGNVVMQNVRVREELHVLRLEPINNPVVSSALPDANRRGHATARSQIGICHIITKLTFLTSVGGKPMGECTRNVMRTRMTDDFVETIN
ncbi:hypothetical protein EG68_12411 [Paragonimus skrjabini miyazakii]|uniref:Uncharacterized protein n=1 Tax=Paragonimus skrjabini miyazakii TaxID=59628 RepID=A0A8S9YCX1_9TREM|nr:hypothetical protein EG68_12411 [Paragonimus skrjabini miyazakii]